MQPVPNASSRRLLSTVSACAYADVSRATLFRLARHGDLHPVRFGRRLVRWPVADLDSWIDRAARAGVEGGEV